MAASDPELSSSPDAPVERHIGLRTASLLVVASMVGSGVFTTTGFLLRDLGDAPAVLGVWVLGGLLATCGALAYGELTAALPENGGEYALLSRIYHPAVGFVSGWVSLVVGFSAPAAAAAVAFGGYMNRVFPAVDATVCAVALILAASALHSARGRLADRVQDAVTVLDVLLVLAFVGAGVALAEPARLVASTVPESSARVLASGSAAVGLVYVSFSYSGWNAAAYVAGEVREPGWTLPRALLLGTGVVTALYFGLNAVFVASAPMEELSGELEVAHLAAAALFGPAAAPWVSLVVAVGLATTVGALVMTGPRIYERMGRDHPRLAVLAGGRRGRGPGRAIALQTGVALALALSATFDVLLTYVGFTLALSSGLTLAGVFVLRWREPELPRPYRAWGHPLTTGLALALMAWMIVFTLVERPLAGLAGLGTIAVGLFLYWLTGMRTHAKGAR